MVLNGIKALIIIGEKYEAETNKKAFEKGSPTWDFRQWLKKNKIVQVSNARAVTIIK